MNKDEAVRDRTLFLRFQVCALRVLGDAQYKYKYHCLLGGQLCLMWWTIKRMGNTTDTKIPFFADEPGLSPKVIVKRG